MSFINNIKTRYKSGNIIEKLIYINLVVFILTLLLGVLKGLFNDHSNFILDWFSLDDNYTLLYTKPWTIITYGF